MNKKRFSYHCIATVLICGAAFAAVSGVAYSQQALNNTDFSEGTASPSGWTLGDKPNPRLRLSRDTQIFKTAPASLRIDIIGGAGAGAASQAFASVPTGSFTISGFTRSSGKVRDDEV
jgi:hypothetical protein